eukprot:5156420-Amphidinium_carterae.1
MAFSYRNFSRKELAAWHSAGLGRSSEQATSESDHTLAAAPRSSIEGAPVRIAAQRQRCKLLSFIP